MMQEKNVLISFTGCSPIILDEPTVGLDPIQILLFSAPIFSRRYGQSVRRSLLLQKEGWWHLTSRRD